MEHLPEWKQASNVYGAIGLFRNLTPILLLYAAAPLAADIAIFLPWAISPLIGLFIYRLTIVMHDCSHGTLFTTKRLNTIVGFSIGAMTGVDFHAFRAKHRKHHQNYGEPGDPQGFHYLGLGDMTRPQMLSCACPHEPL